MNGCPKHRPALALLAAGVANAADEASLRTHLRECSSCRQCLEALERVNLDLVASADSVSQHEPSSDFHPRLLRRLDAAKWSPKSWRVSVRPKGLSAWRWPLGLAALTSVLVIVIVPMRTNRRPQETSPLAGTHPTRLVMTPDPVPNLAAYRRAVNQSPGALEALLAVEMAASDLSPPRITALSRDFPALAD